MEMSHKIFLLVDFKNQKSFSNKKDEAASLKNAWIYYGNMSFQ